MFEKKFFVIATILLFIFAALFFTYPKTVIVYHTITVELPKTKLKQIPNQIECLAKNIYHEAKGEGSLGWLAVGMVTMNRVYSKRYPNTVCEVVYQNNGKVYQFSWAGTKKSLTEPNKKLYNEIKNLAVDIILFHEEMHDITDGALHFHADYVSPKWNKKMNRTIKVGRHIFYKL